MESDDGDGQSDGKGKFGAKCKVSHNFSIGTDGVRKVRLPKHDSRPSLATVEGLKTKSHPGPSEHAWEVVNVNTSVLISALVPVQYKTSHHHLLRQAGGLAATWLLHNEHRID
jgi:hypothetical protein